jgi:hypothetical protein
MGTLQGAAISAAPIPDTVGLRPVTIEDHLRQLQIRLRIVVIGVLVLIVAIKVAPWLPEPYGALVAWWVLLALLIACFVPVVLILRNLRCPRCANGFGWWDAVPHACPKCQLEFRQPYMGPIGGSPFS